MILVVPCPLPNTAPCPVGTTHCTETALAGKPASEYVYCLFGHGAEFTTSITLGVAGLSLVTERFLGALVPQPLLAITETTALVVPAA